MDLDIPALGFFNPSRFGNVAENLLHGFLVEAFRQYPYWIW